MKKITLLLLVAFMIILTSCGDAGSSDIDIYPPFFSDTDIDTELIKDSNNKPNIPSIGPNDSENNTDIIHDSDIFESDTDSNLTQDTDSDIPSTPTYVTVVFNSVGAGYIENMQVQFGESYSLPTPTKYNNSFIGWYYGENEIASKGEWSINQPQVELIAKWKIIDPNIYCISYDFNGGEKGKGNFPLTYNTRDGAIQIGTPIRSGNYKFIGWQANDQIAYNFNIAEGSVGDISLKALWYEYEYTYQDNNGYQYLLKDDNTLSVVGYVGAVSNLIIPSTYENYDVTEIGPYAFCGYGDRIATLQGTSFVRCDISDSITKISTGAFLGCDDLKPQLVGQNNLTTSQWKEKLENWIANLEILEQNDHVLDVINGDRPAIGWKKYWKP